LDASTLEFSRSRLPRPETGPVSQDASGRARTRRANGNGQLTMDLETVASADTPDTDEPTVAVDDSASGTGLRSVNRIAGRCERCTDPIAPSAGSVRVLNNREVMVCWPKCAKEPGSGR
jgi:hypothetical protein